MNKIPSCYDVDKITDIELLRRRCQQMHQLLYQREDAIDELQREVDQHKEQQRAEDWDWVIQTTRKEDLNPDLPLPRLEIRYTQITESQRKSVFALVYRHLCDGVVTVPLGSTTLSGGNPESPIYLSKPVGDRIDLPFRDGAHIYHEMYLLHLPGFVICDGLVEDLCARPLPNYHWLIDPWWATK